MSGSWPAGLCDSCTHAKRLVSGKGSTFTLCEWSRSDPRFPRYPVLPVSECEAWQPEDSPTREESPPAPLASEPSDLASVFRSWWPLAASWLMMGLELPVVSATMARLADPEIHLAAYGGVVFPLSLLIEAPIIMLLSASTALSKNRPDFNLLARFMWVSSFVLTSIHVIVAATPAFDLVVGGWLDAPVEIHGTARLGLLIMTPWTFAIAYRRFLQGVLIRADRSKLIGTGTLVRMLTTVAILLVGLWLDGPGIVVGCTAVAVGVTAEAVFIGWVSRPFVRVLPRDPEGKPLTWRGFSSFYVPLALTPILNLATLPIGSAAISRMPLALESLAVWPVISGLTFLLRSLGFAYNEVVVAALDRPGTLPSLIRFAVILSLVSSGLLLLFCVTPLGIVWFDDISGLEPDLATLGAFALWLGVLLPAGSVALHFYQGVLVHARRTRAITEAVAIYLIVNAALLVAGHAFTDWIGLNVAMIAMMGGVVAQTIWLAVRARDSMRGLS